MSIERVQLQAAIAALQAQRSVLGDGVVDASVASLRARLSAIEAAPPPQPQAAQAAQAAQALRQVSMLFVDVVGSTMLSQHLDPEDTSAVMDAFLRRGTTIVEAHGGRVVQYAGDSLLAVFGAREAAEDDAERAVRCGLSLIDLGILDRDEVQAAHGLAGCHVRVGVHTGEVLLGGGGGVPATRTPSAAWQSTSPRAWSRPPGQAHCTSAMTPTRRCAGCSRCLPPRR